MKGTSESFMHHLVNDRCWPKADDHVTPTSGSFGEKVYRVMVSMLKNAKVSR
jgi:hypothetical protein